MNALHPDALLVFLSLFNIWKPYFWVVVMTQNSSQSSLQHYCAVKAPSNKYDPLSDIILNNVYVLSILILISLNARSSLSIILLLCARWAPILSGSTFPKSRALNWSIICLWLMSDILCNQLSWQSERLWSRTKGVVIDYVVCYT